MSLIGESRLGPCQLGAPVVLFPTHIVGGGADVQQGRTYDVAPDGRSFINTELNSADAPIILLQNWHPEATKQQSRFLRLEQYSPVHPNRQAFHFRNTTPVDVRAAVRLRCPRQSPLKARSSAMTIDERTVGDVKVLDLSGQVTVAQGDTLLKDKVHSLVQQGHRHIVLNMAHVNYVDSSGLGHIVAAYTTVANAGGRLKLVNLTTRLHSLMTITKLLTVFETFDTEKEAVGSFS